MNTRDQKNPPAPGTPPAPPLEYIATIEVDVDAPITVGATVDGVRRVVPIRGGRVHGPGVAGRVLDVGADFQQYPTDDLAYLAADYVLELDDGHHILVQNRALRAGTPEDLRTVMAGGTVDPARIYFCCVPRLTADEAGPHAWMNRTLFIGTGERGPDGVLIQVFRVG
ncbi:DUF3237 family protein [uncultured Kocuria sp.]|uniref:DUF3237 family protein n=1 Tax=uncultured Kocuria sp. TaxID=259305 RepID=UPI002612C213|nr:DUF3237 family protein [uncultured Kocuria sp.]